MSLWLMQRLFAQGIVTRMGRDEDSGRSLEPGRRSRCAHNHSLFRETLGCRARQGAAFSDQISFKLTYWQLQPQA